MSKKINYSELLKETLILTVCCGHRRRCFLFSGAKPCIRQQYFRSWNRSFKLYSDTAVCDHNDFKCTALNHRIFHLRKRIWNQNSLYEYYASAVSWTF